MEPLPFGCGSSGWYRKPSGIKCSRTDQTTMCSARSRYRESSDSLWHLSQRRSSVKNEWEMYYLHPYHTYRILERVASLQELATAAAAHHEWTNGQGYHRQLSGEQIPLHG